MPLTGLQLAWFKVFYNAVQAKDTCVYARPEGRRGIACAEDDWAVRYQVADRRAWRAEASLTGTHYCESMQSFKLDTRNGRLIAVDETPRIHSENWVRWWEEGRRLLPLRRALDAKERLEREHLDC